VECNCDDEPILRKVPEAIHFAIPQLECKRQKGGAGGSVLFKNGGSRKCRIELPDVEVSDTTNA